MTFSQQEFFFLFQVIFFLKQVKIILNKNWLFAVHETTTNILNVKAKYISGIYRNKDKCTDDFYQHQECSCRCIRLFINVIFPLKYYSHTPTRMKYVLKDYYLFIINMLGVNEYIENVKS